jgi:ABC-type glycerol-3-phosphate transport system substrate-binding protein
MYYRGWRRCLLAWIALVVVSTAVCSAASLKTKVTFVPHGATAMYDAHDLENAVKRFEQLNPDVEVELIKAASSWQAYLEQILLRVASGLPTDVITPQPHWPMATIRYVADLTPYMNRDGISVKDFLPGSIDAYFYDGKITGLPLAVVLRGSVYNARLLREAGYQPPANDKWTWDTVRDIGRKLTKDISGDGIPDVYGVHCGGPVRSPMVFPLATQAGGLFFDRFVDPDRSLFDTEPARIALEYFVSFYEQNQTATNISFLRGQAVYSMDGYPMPHGQIESQLGACLSNTVESTRIWSDNS